MPPQPPHPSNPTIDSVELEDVTSTSSSAPPSSESDSLPPNPSKATPTTPKSPLPTPHATLHPTNPSPEYRHGLIGFWNRITYQWIFPIIKRGRQGSMELDDLWDADPRNDAELLVETFEREWKKEVEWVERAEREGNVDADTVAKRKRRAIFYAIWRSWGPEFAVAGVMRLIGDTMAVLSPLVLRSIIIFLASQNKDSGYGYGLATLLFLMQVVQSLLVNGSFERSMRFGHKLRIGLIGLLFRKVLVLSPLSVSKWGQGKIVNILTTDTYRMDISCQFFHMMESALLQIILVAIILIKELGISALVGLALLFLTAPLQFYVMHKVGEDRANANVHSDERVTLTQESIAGIRVIKAYAWEEPFLSLLYKLRKMELKHIRKFLLTRASIHGATQVVPTLAMIFTLICYVQLGNHLDPALTFATLGLFYTLRIPMLSLPSTLTNVVDAGVSLLRIQDLLQAGEVEGRPLMLPAFEVGKEEEESEEVDEEESGGGGGVGVEGRRRSGGSGSGESTDSSATLADGSPIPKLAGYAVEVDNATFVWEAMSDSLQTTTDDHEPIPKSKNPPPPPPATPITTFTLPNITLNLPRGSLTAIIGPVGSGKTSLLSGLVGEMRRSSGSVTFHGRVSYCAQQAWIQNATLKDNILFSSPFDHEKYLSVLKACALERDLKVLPGGDLTEIGERGITLSGGQKQRVNIARALYSDGDVVLFDDPLSAVDAHVGRWLFEKCICGAMSDKTRVLVTHQLHFLTGVDYIIMLDGGQIVEEGTFEELMGRSGGKVRELMREYGAQQEKEREEEEAVREEEEKALDREGREGRVGEESPVGAAEKKEEVVVKKDGELMVKEERETGGLSAGLLKDYVLMSGGWWVLWFMMFLMVFTQVSARRVESVYQIIFLSKKYINLNAIFYHLNQVSRVITDNWLTRWTSHSYTTISDPTYEGIWVGLGLVQIIAITIQSMLAAIAGIWAAEAMHNRALESVFRAPLRFFDTTPLGRIINRFSTDIEQIATDLPEYIRMFLMYISMTAANFVYIATIFPAFIGPLIPAVAVFYWLQDYYRYTSRDLRRMMSIHLSPIVAQLSETLSGLGTIRAYAVESRLIARNVALLTKWAKPYYLGLMIQRWLSFRQEIMSSLLIWATAMFVIGFREKLNPSQAGLCVAYSLQVTVMFTVCIKVFCDMEMCMNSCERLIYYVKGLEREKYEAVDSGAGSKGDVIRSSWPEKGNIDITNLVVRYRPGLPIVLNGISLSIRGGEKIGIVGRTGAGKSSIVGTLLRLVEPEQGSIVVDGVDVLKIGLKDLRSRVAIIPQEPVLFSGTVRSNLDPFKEYSDQQLWDVLDRSNLKKGVASSPQGLDSIVAENGENWSTGQRQLLCLARAMLRNAKVIILDEATASVDLETDEFIQTAIRRDFSTATILTIAHRLNTIADYDRVLVLDHGRVKEYDSPANLLTREGGSQFADMVAETGLVNSALILGLATGKGRKHGGETGVEEGVVVE
ncbi:hypothetical protein HDV00_002198 [Rhizophlyctis rosea]|nr:hypothetical protein HDV00_002198 [Rhizophlyctis rosea]